MMRISVIFTGGTIGSKTDGSNAADKNIHLGKPPYQLLDGVKDTDIEFCCCEPYSILSEELTEAELRRLALCVLEHCDKSDAVIVTHGTDTLVYSAAFLSYMLEPARCPVLLVSSGFPLDDERANGRQNFAAAVALSRTELKGVAVPYFQDGKTVIHHGSRIFRQMPYDDCLYSAGSVTAVISDGQIIGLDDFLRIDRGRSLFSTLAAELSTNELSGFGRAVYLKCLPGMRYPELGGDVGGIILESYHSGTLCSDERFAGFMRKAAELSIPVFVAGAGGRTADYETVEKYRALGAIPLPYASPDAMYVKLCLALSMEGDIVKTMMIPCAGDVITQL